MALRLNGSSSGYVELEVPAAAGSHTLTLPDSGGTSGEYLQTNGSGTLSWASIGNTGKILQVVQNTSTGTFSSTNTTLVTVVTRTITPVAASSKILIIGQCGQADGTNVDSFSKFVLTEGTTELWVPGTSIHNTNNTNYKQATEVSFMYLHEPTYTLGDELSYNLKFCNNASNGTMYVRNGNNSLICLEVAA